MPTPGCHHRELDKKKERKIKRHNNTTEIRGRMSAGCGAARDKKPSEALKRNELLQYKPNLKKKKKKTQKEQQISDFHACA